MVSSKSYVQARNGNAMGFFGGVGACQGAVEICYPSDGVWVMIWSMVVGRIKAES